MNGRINDINSIISYRRPPLCFCLWARLSSLSTPNTKSVGTRLLTVCFSIYIFFLFPFFSGAFRSVSPCCACLEKKSPGVWMSRTSKRFGGKPACGHQKTKNSTPSTRKSRTGSSHGVSKRPRFFLHSQNRTQRFLLQSYTTLHTIVP